MRSQVIKRALLFLLTLVMVIGGTSIPAVAGEDRGLCNENHDRVSIPRSFPLDACFDGGALYIKNGTQFPLVLTFTGSDVGTPERYTKGAGGASRLLVYLQPRQFGRTPVINAPDSRSGLIPPGYYVKAPIGNGEVKVQVNTAGADIQKRYVIAEAIWRFLPTEIATETMKAVAELIRELSDVGDQYVACRDRNNAWGDIGCSALLGRNVTFAFGRAAVNGLGSGVVKAIISLFDAASWADAASGDLIQFRDGQRNFTIAAAKPPAEAPKENPRPAPANPGNGSSGGGGNNPPPANNPAPAPPPQPQTATATVQNMHLEGATGLAEDSTPSYLSSRMQPRCASNGCKLGGTDMWSGATFTAFCWDTGAMMTNENRNISSDDSNPHRVDSDRWLKGEKNGSVGYISYIYLTPGSRGLGLPHC